MMIDFACKRFDKNQVIKCGLGLTKADFEIMQLLVSTNDEMTTEDIADRLKVNLSTAQRAVKKLHEKNIVKRMQKNLDGGGYFFVYVSYSRDVIRKQIISIVRKWADKVEEEINKW